MEKKYFEVIPLAGQEFPSQPGYPPQPVDPPQKENFLSSAILQILRQIKKTFYLFLQKTSTNRVLSSNRRRHCKYKLFIIKKTFFNLRSQKELHIEKIVKKPQSRDLFCDGFMGSTCCLVVIEKYDFIIITFQKFYVAYDFWGNPIFESAT